MHLCLAPMDGITTCATRFLTKEIFEKYKNPDDSLMLRTEFMNVEGFLISQKSPVRGRERSGRGSVVKHLQTTPGQQPIAQIYGGNEDTLVEAAKKIEREYGERFSWIELNTGCPSNTVMKCGGGSDMMKNREKTLRIIQHLSESLTKLPFSIKARAGLNEEDKEKQADFLIAASKYCSKISIHGRTLKQLYSGETDRDFIQHIKCAIQHHIGSPWQGGGRRTNENEVWERTTEGGLHKKILCQIIGNGGITSYQQAQEYNERHQVDGIMIGQAAIGNPRIFTPHHPSHEEKLETILRHLDLSVACDQLFEKHPINIPIPDLEQQIQINLKNTDFSSHSIIEFRKFLFQYVKGIPESREWKTGILSVKKYGELRQEIRAFFEKTSPLDIGL